MGAHRMACRKNSNSAVWALGRNRYLMLQMFDLYMPIYLVYCWDCREKAQHEKLQMLGNHNSPLSYVDLKDIVNFDEFSGHLTNEEQQQLLKYLPSIDTARLPDSLKNMFASPQFEDNLSSFQKLLAEGVFDLSFSSVKAEEYSTLNRLALCNLTKSKWVEQYNLLKGQSANRGSVVQGGTIAIASGKPTNVKRLHDGQPRTFPGTKTTIKIPKRVTKGGIYEHKELVDNDGSCFSPRSLFALPPDSSSLMLDSFQFMDESSDQDLLLDVQSNNSFPQAELLFPTSSFGAQSSTSSSSIQPQLVRPSK
ncbi:hypothetical protein RHGRI_030612 [Rhododendron griersonianum]|uniref:DEUBAD domain-containing protein n=1 Tax=Rhododendron griersonianum TaxID=479676 RepID=A0AAV6I5A3_9ERIC|nr:hypothetical protein RHGRI_030612 [Rhododendron griersonianum]